MDTNTLGITREEILELAAQKLADQYSDESDLSDLANKKINERIERLVGNTLAKKVDETLTAEVEKLLRTEVVPVDIWGDKTGEPTTIKAALHKRAAEFWSEKVDGDGKPSTYYSGKPRHEWLFSKIAAEEFSKAIKQDFVNIIGALKDSLRADYAKRADEYLNELIKVKSLGDSKS